MTWLPLRCAFMCTERARVCDRRLFLDKQMASPYNQRDFGCVRERDVECD
jgi:hypothetical protein